MKWMSLPAEVAVVALTMFYSRYPAEPIQLEALATAAAAEIEHPLVLAGILVGSIINVTVMSTLPLLPKLLILATMRRRVAHGGTLAAILILHQLLHRRQIARDIGWCWRATTVKHILFRQVVLMPAVRTLLCQAAPQHPSLPRRRLLLLGILPARGVHGTIRTTKAEPKAVR